MPIINLTNNGQLHTDVARRNPVGRGAAVQRARAREIMKQRWSHFSIPSSEGHELFSPLSYGQKICAARVRLLSRSRDFGSPHANMCERLEAVRRRSVSEGPFAHISPRCRRFDFPANLTKRFSHPSRPQFSTRWARTPHLALAWCRWHPLAVVATSLPPGIVPSRRCGLLSQLNPRLAK